MNVAPDNLDGWKSDLDPYDLGGLLRRSSWSVLIPLPVVTKLVELISFKAPALHKAGT